MIDIEFTCQKIENPEIEKLSEKMIKRFKSNLKYQKKRSNKKTKK